MSFIRNLFKAKPQAKFRLVKVVEVDRLFYRVEKWNKTLDCWLTADGRGTVSYDKEVVQRAFNILKSGGSLKEIQVIEEA